MKLFGKILAIGSIALSSLSAQAQAPNNYVERHVASFHQVNVNGDFEVVLVQGNKESVLIDGTNVNVSDILTQCVEGELYVKMRQGAPAAKVKMTITYKALDELTAAGTSSVKLESALKSDALAMNVNESASVKGKAEVEKLQIKTDGNGSVSLCGNVDKLKASLKGDSNFDSSCMQSKSSNVNILGTGSAQVNVVEKLDGSIKGSGDILYKGEPKSNSVSVSGSGKVKKLS